MDNEFTEIFKGVVIQVMAKFLGKKEGRDGPKVD
jgi:hypothetical protein